MKALFGWVLVALGACVIVLGLGFTAMYVIEAVIKRIGEPDQSLVFWYLPILFIGGFGILAGSGVLALGIKRLRGPRKAKERSEAQSGS